MNDKLKIMFVPMEQTEHVNAGLALAQVLHERGHQIIFAVNESHRELVRKFDFDVEVVESSVWKLRYPVESELRLTINYPFYGEILSRPFLKIPLKMFLTVKSNLENYVKYITYYFIKDYKLKKIIKKYHPDIFVIDDLFCYTAVIYSKKPWVWLFSKHIMSILQQPIPTFTFGGLFRNKLYLRQSIGWAISLAIRTYLAYSYRGYFMLTGNGFASGGRFLPNSPYLNIYAYPKELDYGREFLPFKNTLRLDSFLRPNTDDFEISGDLKDFIENSKNSKLIFVTMQVNSTSDLNNMKKLVNILGKSNHRYIVLKGYSQKEYEMPDNMWGDGYVPHSRVLAVSDLVITDNTNTAIETFIMGKPQIVVPAYLDQHDIANQIHDLKYGIKLSWRQVSQQSVLGAIDKMLLDNKLKDRLSVVSKRIQGSSKMNIVVQMIENLQ